MKTALLFDDKGTLLACHQADMAHHKNDWCEREQVLQELLEHHRPIAGANDVLIPGRGGKDSVKAP